jgi:hypothetical protein
MTQEPAGREERLAVVRTFRLIEIDGGNEDDVAHADLVFEALCRVEMGVAITFYPEVPRGCSAEAIAKWPPSPRRFSPSAPFPIAC